MATQSVGRELAGDRSLDAACGIRGLECSRIPLHFIQATGWSVHQASFD